MGLLLGSGNLFAHNKDDGTGFRTDTKVVGSRSIIQIRKMRSIDFLGLSFLTNTARAIETFLELQKEGSITEEGEVLIVNLKLGGVHFSRGQLVSISIIRNAIAHEFTPGNAITRLIQAKVLDSDGFVLGLSKEKTKEFNEASFLSVQKSLEKAKFPIENTKMTDALRRESYRIILAAHEVQEVSSLESTHYQSNNNNMFNNFVESFVGNSVSKVAYPNQINTTAHEVVWVNTTDPYEFFQEFYLRFNRFPYSRGGMGIVVLNGDPVRREFSYSTLSTKDHMGKDLTTTHFSLVTRISGSRPLTLSAAPQGFLGLRLTSDTVRQSSTENQYFGLGVEAGTLSDYSMTSVGLGLALQNGSGVSNLGVKVSLEAAWFVINPISLHFGMAFASQPNFITKTDVFRYTTAEAALNFHLDRLALGLGYRLDNERGAFYLKSTLTF